MALLRRVEKGNDDQARAAWHELLWLNDIVAGVTDSEKADVESMVVNRIGCYGHIKARCNVLGLLHNNTNH
jgi:hypothetical protein